ncbi:hypothetical protein EDC01DRAFT_678054 [Geopyxis carbonaria]|nr:hypothetical protein EDC01DRAFT_678054 [Geopyxis carbonaria]
MPRLTIFHIFYSTSFSLIFLLLSTLLLITPGDAIAQALIHNKQYYNVFILAGAYLLTACIALWLYLARVLAVRASLAAIPRTAAPPPLPPRIRRVVSDSLTRSAILTATARPAGGSARHGGWAPPTDCDLQGVEYAAIIASLPPLIESRVPGWGARRPAQTLRAYLDPIIALPEVTLFLELYERARWRRRGRGVQEDEFRALMKSLAGLMRVLDGDRESAMTSTTDGEDFRFRNYSDDDEPVERMQRMRRIATETTTMTGGEDVPPSPGLRRRVSPSGGSSVELDELAATGRRRLSLRASSGTFG